MRELPTHKGLYNWKFYVGENIVYSSEPYQVPFPYAAGWPEGVPAFSNIVSPGIRFRYANHSNAPLPVFPEDSVYDNGESNGKISRAAAFPGGRAYTGALENTAGFTSVAFWAKIPDGLAQPSNFLSIGWDGDCGFRFMGDGSVRFRGPGAEPWFLDTPAEPALNDDGWHLYCVTVRDGTALLFVDGVVRDTLAIPSTVLKTAQEITLGPDFDGTDIDHGEGTFWLDSVSFWDRPLTDADVSRLWNNGAGLPYENFG